MLSFFVNTHRPTEKNQQVKVSHCGQVIAQVWLYDSCLQSMVVQQYGKSARPHDFGVLNHVDSHKSRGLTVYVHV